MRISRKESDIKQTIIFNQSLYLVVLVRYLVGLNTVIYVSNRKGELLSM